MARRRLLVLCLVCWAITGCHLRRQPPSVIWIVVDTLRADHLEWYGYARPTSPSLRSLAAEGSLFTRAYTPAPQTTPAIASMFTGLYPARHGLRSLYQLLHDDNRTAAEIFAGAGYDTAAFVSSFVMVRNFSNLGQGFALYDDFVGERELFRDNYERKAAATLELAARWAQERRDERPFFLFVHLIDPHGPYAPPGEFAGRFRSAEAVEVEGAIPAYQQIPGVRDLNRYRDLYDGEIAYADAALGRFLDVLDDRGLLAGSLVVFTADHGESMGEHGLYFRHGDDVFQENVHVPLIVKPPAGFGEVTRRVPDVVSHVDLLPTVLEIAGLPVPAALDGRSLVSSLRGEGGRATAVFAMAEAAGESSVALIEGHRKTVVHRRRGVRSMSAYDLARDPRESSPEPAADEDVARIRARRAEWATRLPFTVRRNFLPERERGAFLRRHVGQRTREDLERLRSLGYVR
jgi:arylsulfatase A-like enzyme